MEKQNKNQMIPLMLTPLAFKIIAVKASIEDMDVSSWIIRNIELPSNYMNSLEIMARNQEINIELHKCDNCTHKDETGFCDLDGTMPYNSDESNKCLKFVKSEVS